MINKLLFSAFFLSTFFLKAQNLEIDTLLTDKISIRAIQLWDGKVWYSGTDAKFGFIDWRQPKNQKQIKVSEKSLQFRTLGQNDRDFFLASIESPGYLFKINKKSLKVEKVFQDDSKSAFYDALLFVNNKVAYAFSDSNNGKMKLLTTKDGGDTWFFSKVFDKITLREGEAAFAASNTNIAAKGSRVWIATGGKSSRIFRMETSTSDKIIAEVFNTPFVQGSSSQGMYSIDFANETFGIAVGGDYTLQSENKNNIATTEDGGATWQIQASGANAGYMTCVRIKPGSQGKEIIAVGDQHISYSQDYGKTWKVISHEKNLYVAEWVDASTLIFAGKDRIIKVKIKS
ncbi:glycosyl hydrolase [Elizabethkingia sp. JS20170427COW]|nr:glycosyl hydrolase [Elizabethkingia sp. JS20170427COW]